MNKFTIKNRLMIFNLEVCLLVLLHCRFCLSIYESIMDMLTLLSLGGVIFARSKFKFKLFLNGLWYEPETLWLFLTFTRDYFAGKKKIQKNIKLSGGNIFLYRGYCQKIGVRICRNSFSCRIKYLHV